MNTLLALFCVLLYLPPVASPAQAGWKRYAALGFSFRYPAAFELREHANADPDAGPTYTVDLYAPDIDPQRTYLGRIDVLRVAVWQHDARHGAAPISFYEKQKNYRALKVGGRSAGQFVDCGSAACHWKIMVYGSRELWIFTGDPDEDAKSGPDNSRYPFLQIIDSFVFDSTFPK